jgi:hypothetical protein
MSSRKGPYFSPGKTSCKLTCETFVVGDEQCDCDPDSVKQTREVETSSRAWKMNQTNEARKIKRKGKQNDGQNFNSSVRKLTCVYPMDNLFA